MVRIKFNDDGVVLYDLTPQAIGAVSQQQNDINLDDILSQLIELRNRVYALENQPTASLAGKIFNLTLTPNET